LSVGARRVDYGVSLKDPLARRCFHEQSKRALCADRMTGKVGAGETRSAYRDDPVAGGDASGEFAGSRQGHEDVIDEFGTSKNRVVRRKSAAENFRRTRREIHPQR
jgi:hypothetical protein